MKQRGRLLFALFAAASLLFLSVVTPTMGEGRLEEEEGCTVGGHVYVVETEKPIRETPVIIHKISDTDRDVEKAEINTFITVTNGEGYYEFVDIPAGEYYLVVAYGSDFEWGRNDRVCMGTYHVHIWVDVDIAGMYHTEFEVEDGESIVVDAPIEPIHFHESWGYTFGPPPMIP